MTITIKEATSDAERESIFRLRYDIYVDQMNRYRSVADHENRLFTESDDAQSRHYLAIDDGEVVGTMRLTWGIDAPFTQRHIDQYDLTPWIAEVPQEQMVIGERFMVTKPYRGTDLIYRMFCSYLEYANEKRVQLIFGNSEPHLLSLYQGLGFRTYTRNHVNSPETGYLIPLLMVLEDFDYFRQLNSPLIKVLKDFGADARVPECVPRLLAQGSAVQSHRLVPRENYWQDVQTALALVDHRVQLFDGLSEKQIENCLSKSNVIDCQRGDRLIKKGNVATNMYIVLSGSLEIRDEHTTVDFRGPGDILGELAFLLESPRSMDVYANSDDVRVLSLSDSAIKKLIDHDAEAAAALLLNVSKMLCYKLLRLS